VWKLYELPSYLPTQSMLQLKTTWEVLQIGNHMFVEATDTDRTHFQPTVNIWHTCWLWKSVNTYSLLVSIRMNILRIHINYHHHFVLK
jgi:hypothetical protein